MQAKSGTIIGIPGPWEDHSTIVQSVASANAGRYIYAGNILKAAGTRSGFAADVCDYNPHLAEAFAIAGRGRLKPEELAAIAAHRTCVYLVANGGSVESADAMMNAGCALLAAGGVAVNVESAGKAHGATTWKRLTAGRKPNAFIHAFVTMASDQTDNYSCGMHNLGLPDAIMAMSVGQEEAERVMNVFLLHLLTEKPEYSAGNTFSAAPNGPQYKLSREACTVFGPEHPFHNRFGMWRLSPR